MTNLKNSDLAALANARAMAHRASQHLTQAARANLPAQPDDSHSNLGWDIKTKAFLSQPIDGKFIGLSLTPLTLFIANNEMVLETLPLDGVTADKASKWLDETLLDLGLILASKTEIPYELPIDVNAISTYNDSDDLVMLSVWFDAAAQSLENFVSNNSDLIPGPSAVRCWPHHFDIATYVSLESGDAETARGIGVGMSPGDEGYNEPYLYINPWPHLDTNALPAAVTPGHWHVEGYVGSIATASELLTQGDIGQAMSAFIAESFAVSIKLQGV